ncbi:pyridoxal-phosphate dependent enzyme [Bacillus sp. E214]|uniref:threonine synthase n=1 Tax=Bacillus sp. E214 TaxID=2587156 RepID=UPI0011E03079|nr:pyridoxal-phosphate dependent enzyme [Bacillus sp. E214]
MSEIQFICVDCQELFMEETDKNCCTCGGLLIIKTSKSIFKDNWIVGENQTMWKYYLVVSVQANKRAWEKVSLGEGNTVLDKLDSDNQHIYLKLENTLPSQSYIDRCSALLVTKLLEKKIQNILIMEATCMSLSVAKYAKHAQIACELALPENTACQLVDAYRNEGVRVSDFVSDQESAANNFILPDFHPYMIEGAKTYAYEIWEQLGHRHPDIVTFSVETSMLAVGTYYGFKDLLEHHLIGKLPRFIIVDIQSTSLPVKSKAVSIPQPLYKELIKMIKETDGHLQTITKTEIIQASKALFMRGYQIDEQSAAAYAGCMRYYRDFSIKNESIVIPLSNFSEIGKSK